MRIDILARALLVIPTATVPCSHLVTSSARPATAFAPPIAATMLSLPVVFSTLATRSQLVVAAALFGPVPFSAILAILIPFLIATTVAIAIPFFFATTVQPFVPCTHTVSGYKCGSDFFLIVIVAYLIPSAIAGLLISRLVATFVILVILTSMLISVLVIPQSAVIVLGSNLFILVAMSGIRLPGAAAGLFVAIVNTDTIICLHLLHIASAVVFASGFANTGNLFESLIFIPVFSLPIPIFLG